MLRLHPARIRACSSALYRRRVIIARRAVEIEVALNIKNNSSLPAFHCCTFASLLTTRFSASLAKSASLSIADVDIELDGVDLETS